MALTVALFLFYCNRQGNNRGNTYSRSHTKWSPKSKEFWSWSWDQMAAIDLPTQLNYVLATTKARSIRAYVGHR